MLEIHPLNTPILSLVLILKQHYPINLENPNFMEFHLINNPSWAIFLVSNLVLTLLESKNE